MEGFITLHRKIMNWEWYTDNTTFKLFIHLLLSANHEEKKWRGQTIGRGQLITSVNHLSEETGLTTQQVRTAINKLKSTNEITIKTTNKFTLVTIEKYSDYQDIREKDNKQNNKQVNKQITNKQQTNNKQITTNNNDNNVNNITNNKESKKESKQTFDAIINGYTENEILRQELKNHLATRKAKKATLTNRAIELSLKTLDKLTKDNQDKDIAKIDIVRQSIERGWTGFFDLKKETKTKEERKTYNNYEQREVLDFSKFYANGGN